MTLHVIDCETGPNYFLLLAMNAKTGVVQRWERHNDVERGRFELADLRQLLKSHSTTGFNSSQYDQWVTAAYLQGFTNEQIYHVSKHIIEVVMGSYSVADAFGLEPLKWQHIDIMPIAPLMASLKAYGARIHAPTIASLPIDPDAQVTEAERQALIPYCVNDLDLTLRLFRKVKPEIDLRVAMSRQYGIKLHSKSDAQIAEGVIRGELKGLGVAAWPHQLITKELYRYEPPDYLGFKSGELHAAFRRSVNAHFELSTKGKILLPAELREPIRFAGCTYKMGIGGLHSQEKKQVIVPGEGEALFDLDITSMYPTMILNNGWAPETLGASFLQVYGKLVRRRVEAKHAGDKTTADSLKICVNASFGKFANRYSALYDPKLLLQTTVTGQLSLLMLIEQIETGTECTVVSANTDGVVIHAPRPGAAEAAMKLAARWQVRTRLTLERTDYLGLWQQDVSNYVALKSDDTLKGKGVFAAPSLSKNPQFAISTEAAVAYLTKGTPVDITLFDRMSVEGIVAARKVKGGGLHRDRLVGTTVRWYMSTDGAPLTYASNNHAVPLADRCEIANVLPAELPADVHWHWYEQRAIWLINQTGTQYTPDPSHYSEFLDA